MSKPTALVVEDEFIIAMELEERLLKFGFRCVWHASSYESAIAAARTHLPDIVLLDIQLGGELDGIDAAQIIGPELGIPVVFMTATADAETRKRAAIAAPCSTYLTKPFDETSLRRTLASIEDRI